MNKLCFFFYLYPDMFDKNSSGTIDVNEFQQLFNYINQWKGVFQSFDKDRSGKIEQQELVQGNFLWKQAVSRIFFFVRLG